MRVRVTFRYRADTGEVEAFLVEDAHDGPPRADHDARHEAATRALGRIVDPHPSISEIVEAGAEPVAEALPADAEPARAEDRRLRD